MLEQAGNIIARMTDPNDTRGIDFENDWKMATLFIGGNDFCGYCDDRVIQQRHYPKMKLITILCDIKEENTNTNTNNK